jgi:tape measure domain-containing protein
MGLLGNLLVKLGVDTSQFTSGLTAAAGAANRFSTTLASSFNVADRSANIVTNDISLFSKKTSSGFKDVARIAQGIMVSQAFYRTVDAIKQATSALGEFSMQLEDAHMSFGVLMKDSDKANRFTQYLQDFAAKTPFTMQQSVDQARKLLAYGFSPDNMNPIMSTLADASAASGDAQTFERVGRALGQIRTKGKLAQQELLQLTEAGIPAFEILRDKLHLTSDEMGKIGKLGISSDVAINAILKGMQERYGGAANMLAETTKGMLSTIKDDMLIIGADVSKPLYEGFGKTVRKIRDSLDKIREEVRQGGPQAFFQHFIPPSLYPQLQLLVAGVKMLFNAFARLAAAFAPLSGAFWEFTIEVLNLAIPVIGGFINILAVLIHAVTSCSPFIRGLVAAIGGLLIIGGVIWLVNSFVAVLKGLFIVRIVTQLIIFLAQAFRLLAITMVTNPILGVLALATGALLAFGMTSKTVSGWLTGIGSKITSAFGYDPSKTFAPKMKENNYQAEEFNKNLTLTDDKLKNAGKQAEKTNKKVKDMLMSFDEVFDLKDQDENQNPDAGDLSDIGDIGAPPIPPISVPDAEYPDPTEGITSFFDNFVNTFKDKMRSTLIGAGLGALLGALIGGLLFGPEGAKWGAIIGAGVGGIIGYFWDALSDKQKWTVGGAGVGAALGALIGFILFGPLGAAVGALLGGVIGGIIGNWWSGLTEAQRWTAGVGAGAGAIIGGIIGTLICPGIGTVIGALLGAGLGAWIGSFWADMTDSQKWSVGIGSGAGAIIGGIIGTLIAPGIGTVVGALIGGGIGGLIGDYWAGLTDEAKWAEGGSAAGMTIGGVIGTLICPGIGTVVGAGLGLVIGNLAGSWWSTMTSQQQWEAGTGAGAGALIGGIIGTLICPGIGTVVGALLGGGLGAWIGKYWEDMKAAFSTDTGQGTAIGAIIGTLIGGPIGTVIGGFLGAHLTDIENWCTQTQQRIGTWWDQTNQGFQKWRQDNNQGFTQWQADTEAGIASWIDNTLAKISGWWTDSKTKFDDWWSTTNTGFDTWWTNTEKGFDDWKGDTWTKLSNWATDTMKAFDDWRGGNDKAFDTWWADTKKGFDDWKQDTTTKVTNWATDTYGKFTSWYTDSKTKFDGWWSDTKTGFSTWYTDTTGSVSKWYTDAMSSINSWYTDSKQKLSDWWSETKTGFDEWGKNAWQSVSDYFGKMIDKINSAIDKAKDFSNQHFSTHFSTSSSSSDDDDMEGHATGGIFNKEHIARFAEGNKAEAVIPLENQSAMQPFVDAVAQQLQNTISANVPSGSTDPDIQQVETTEVHYHIGTLIADDRGLKKLQQKLNAISKEDERR